MKKTLLILMILFNVMASNVVFSAGKYIIMINGQEIHLSTPVLIEEAIISMPIRDISESLGAKVEWNPHDNSILITKNQKKIFLQMNDSKARIDNQEVSLDAPIRVMNNHALVPISFLVKAFPIKIEVDIDKKVIKVSHFTYGFLLTAKAHILVEPKSGLILFEHNSHEKLKAASVGKIMNLLLIFEAIDDKKISLDNIVIASEQAAKGEGSQLFLEKNEKISVETLIKSIIMIGANDSSIAMAEYIAGSKENFVELMNQKAKKLGMKDTYFANVLGTDAKDQYTSAYDIAIMTRELIMKHPVVLKYASIQQEEIIRTTDESGEKPFTLTNLNKLLKWYNGATGLKTGYTGNAKYCLVGTAKRKDLQLITVVLGAPDYKAHFEESMMLFEYGFNNYNILEY